MTYQQPADWVHWCTSSGAHEERKCDHAACASCKEQHLFVTLCDIHVLHSRLQGCSLPQHPQHVQRPAASRTRWGSDGKLPASSPCWAAASWYGSPSVARHPQSAWTGLGGAESAAG